MDGRVQNSGMPWAVRTPLLASAVILFLLFGSLAIPLKAVVVTLLSLSASFGYTIAANPIIMFAVLIGLSMACEALLLSRIQEPYRRIGNNTTAVAEGHAKTAGMITGAAMIMVVVFGAFALAEVVTIKSIGVGMSIAVLVDATVIRVLLVPAMMRPLGECNECAPGILGRVADRLGFSHVEDAEGDVEQVAPTGARTEGLEAREHDDGRRSRHDQPDRRPRSACPWLAMGA